MQQGSSAGGTATLTDEQILGLDEGAATSGTTSTSLASEAARGASGAGLEPGLADQGGLAFDDGTAGNGARVADRLAQLNGTERGAAASGVRENDATSGAGEGEPAWLAALQTEPAAAAEARRWRDAAKDISSIDAAYFSSEPGARSGLAERLYQSDPAAFRAMLAESARTLAARDPQGLAELARQLGMPEAAAPLRPRSVSQAARPATESPAARDKAQPNLNSAAPTGLSNADASSRESSATNSNAGAAFPAEAYRAFESSTNEDVGRRMHEAIDRTLASTLPHGIAEGARRRIGEDVFREVHASLASDRELSRRVVAEWTSSVLASDRAKTARIDSAAARRDITGGRLPEPVSSSALRPRDVDYRRLSDEQILEM